MPHDFQHDANVMSAKKLREAASLLIGGGLLLDEALLAYFQFQILPLTALVLLAVVTAVLVATACFDMADSYQGFST